MPTCILVVDNEPDIVDVLKKGLEANGYEVDAFTDPREALSHFKAGRYDLIILDIRMPNMNGFALSRELLKRDSKPKVCFMTAFDVDLSESRIVFPSLKVDAFLRKPIGVKEIVRMIQTTLKGNY